MNNDWIAFVGPNGTAIDFVLSDGEEQKYPYDEYCVTAHHGIVMKTRIIERRKAVTKTEVRDG